MLSRSSKRLIAGLMACAAVCGVGRHADAALILSLSNPFPLINPTGSAQTVVISGTIYNAGSTPATVTQMMFNNPIYDLAGDTVSVLPDLGTPIVIAPLGSYTGTVIELSIAANQAIGLYNRDSVSSPLLPVVEVDGTSNGTIVTGAATFAANVAVPEPASLGLLGVAGVSLLRRRRVAVG